MYSSLLALFSVVTILSLRVYASGKCIVQVLPQHSDVSCAARYSTNSLETFHLNTIFGSDDYYDLTVGLFYEVFDNNICSEVIGVVGDLDYNTASIIHTLASRYNLSLTLVASSTPPTSLPVSNLDLHNVLDMNPLQHYADALIDFMNQLNWTRIGLISEDTYYHLFAAEILQRRLLDNPERTIAPYIRLASTDNGNLDVILHQFEGYGTKIIILLVGRELECSILHAALEMGIEWPLYSLILVGLDRLRARESPCNIADGVFLLENSMLYEDSKFRICGVNSRILHDSILAVTSAESLDFNDASFEGSTGTLNFRGNKLLTNISILQFQGGKGTVTASYNSDLQELQFHPEKFSGDAIPSGRFETVDSSSSALHISLVVIVFFIAFSFITVNLVLYFVFREEPEVKASSVIVSMCMFLGCYLLILFVPLLLLEGEPIAHTKTSATLICTLLVWLSTIGLPFSFIFATLIVKMARVYFIFSKPFSYKKKAFSNPALLLYILAIIFPTILILILPAALDDKYTKVRIVNRMKSHAFVYDRCLNRYTVVWGLLLFLYNSILAVALSVLAIISSKIRYKRFTDTKATNAFTYLSIFIAFTTVVYWYVLRFIPLSRENVEKSRYTLYIGHVAEALLCQIFLFVPKVFPPAKRWLSRNDVKRKDCNDAHENKTTVHL